MKTFGNKRFYINDTTISIEQKRLRTSFDDGEIKANHATLFTVVLSAAKNILRSYLSSAANLHHGSFIAIFMHHGSQCSICL